MGKLMFVLAALFYGPPKPAPTWPPTLTMTECHDVAGNPALFEFNDGIIRPVCITPDREWYLLKLELN